jgi:hypothetical protein
VLVVTEQPEKQMGQPEEEVAVQPEILHHHRIHRYLIMEDRGEDVPPDGKGESKNWNFQNLLRLGNLRGSKVNQGMISIPGG